MEKCRETNCELNGSGGRGFCDRHYAKYRYLGTLDQVAPLLEKVCPWCNQTFMPSKWSQEVCSDKCRHALKYREHRPKIAVERPCKWCGSIISVKRRLDAIYCTDECQQNGYKYRVSKELWEQRSADRIGKKCLACEELLPEHKQKNSEYCTRFCKLNARNLRKYGLTVPEYKALLLSQGGVCKICKTDQFGADRAAAVDHDHVTGKVRGLLCMSCNNGLGRFKDNPILLERAIHYLKGGVS